jgi:hypothetical protein
MTRSWLLLVLLSGFVLLGFVAHTSSGEGLLLDKYSNRYAAALAALSLLWLLLIYWGWRNSARLDAILRVIGVNLLVTVILLAIVLPGIYIYLHHKYLQENVFTTIDTGAHAFFQIDWAPPLPASTWDDEIRVLALGGSTTYGEGLERKQAYPAILEELLNKRFTGQHFVVFNAGVPWHTTMHSLLRYVGIYSDWEPHIVLVMHAFNDIYQTSEGRLTSDHYRADYGHFSGALGNRVNPHDRFADTTARLLTRNWFARNWYSDLSSAVSNHSKPTVDLTRALPSFKRNLEEIAKRVHDDHVELVLITQPYLYHENMSRKEKESLFYDVTYRDYAVIPSLLQQRAAMDKFNDCVRALAVSVKAGLVDLEVALPKDQAMMYDDLHYTVAGARRVAELVLNGFNWATIADRNFSAKGMTSTFTGSVCES